MIELKKLRRPLQDATQEERRHYFRDLRDMLDANGIGPGDEFMVLKPLDSNLDATAPPQANALGHFQRQSETSRRAALDNYPRNGTQRWRVLVAIAGAAVRGSGLTRDELIVALDMPPNVLTPRVRELLDGGWVREDPDRTRKTRSGSEAAVLFVTDKGLNEYRKEAARGQA